MKKFLEPIGLALLLVLGVTGSADGQRKGQQSHQAQQHQPQQHQAQQRQPQQHQQEQRQSQQHQSQPRTTDRGHFAGDGGRHTSDASRGHYDGRHFDSGFHQSHFGRDHRFNVGRPVFFNGGYRFYYGGFWFGYNAWPYGCGYDDNSYIDEDGDAYFLYNPCFPGGRIIVNVIN